MLSMIQYEKWTRGTIDFSRHGHVLLERKMDLLDRSEHISPETPIEKHITSSPLLRDDQFTSTTHGPMDWNSTIETWTWHQLGTLPVM